METAQHQCDNEQTANRQPASIDESVSSCHRASMQRMQEYQLEALSSPNALHASIGSLNSGLMRISLGLQQAIEREMAIAPLSMDGLQRVFRALETNLRVTRQIDRFTHTLLKGEDSEPAPVAVSRPSEEK